MAISEGKCPKSLKDFVSISIRRFSEVSTFLLGQKCMLPTFNTKCEVKIIINNNNNNNNNCDSYPGK